MNKGAVLINVLILSLLVLTTLTAYMLYGVSSGLLLSDYVKYSNSLNLAESGINKQINILNQNVSAGLDTTFTQSSPYIASFPTLGGEAKTWLSSPTQAFVNTLTVNSIGSYNGVNRFVTVQVKKRGIFDDFAYFAFSPSSIGGGSLINGSVGTNSNLVFSGSSTTSGELYSFGNSSLITGIDKPITRDMNQVAFPTINSLVSKRWQNGWSWLTSNNPVNRSNGKISVYSGLYTSIPATPAELKWNSNNFDLSNASFNKFSSKATLVFPAGDYYFQTISLQSNVNLIVDNASGPVNFWISDSTLDDKVSGTITFIYTNPQDPSSFRFYYNKPSTLSLGGNSVLGGIYAVRKGMDAATKPAIISMSGGSTVTGSIIGDVINMQGNSSINHPTNMIGANDPAARFVFDKIYKEQSLNNQGVFVDGSQF